MPNTLTLYDTELMDQHALKNVSNCLNINIHLYFEKCGGQSSNLYLNVVHFFQRHCKLDICGNLRQLFSYLGLKYVLYYYGHKILLYCPWATTPPFTSTKLSIELTSISS